MQPPSDAAAVTLDRLRLKKITVVKKVPSAFRPGYWDIEIKYVFVYTLTFTDSRGDVICSIRANSVCNKTCTLFGSIGSDIVIGTDFMGGESDTMDADPFVFCEGKAVPLSAELKYCRCKHKDCNRDCDDRQMDDRGHERGACEVLVTIGLFCIVDLCRMVDLTVESRGFSIPHECDEVSPLNPCEFFDDLEFPMNIFAPPELSAFGSEHEHCKRNKKGDDDCGCGR